MQRFINNWAASLAAPALAADQQMTLDRSLPALPAGDHYLLTLASRDYSGVELAWEVVKVTAIGLDSITVARGQDGTTARDWPVDSPIQLRLTAGYLTELQTTIADLSERLAALETPPNALTDSNGATLTDANGATLTGV